MKSSNMKSGVSNPDAVREKVRVGYSQIALQGSERRKSSCCSGMAAVDSEKLARQIGYAAEELAALPEGANIGLSCGNPSALAALRPGEVLLDLGGGGGEICVRRAGDPGWGLAHLHRAMKPIAANRVYR
jgi:arsenite methyltransferase